MTTHVESICQNYTGLLHVSIRTHSGLSAPWCNRTSFIMLRLCTQVQAVDDARSHYSGHALCTV